MRLGRYEIVRFIGEGGMGAVYEAIQEAPHRSVALKLIRPGLLTPPMLSRFRREAEALGRLQDAGIAQIYEAGSANTPYGPQPYLAMELVRGEPITQFANARGLSVDQRLVLVARAAESVHHAHQRGVIHRDLKPGNILVTDAGGDGGLPRPKVLDFGLAKRTDADVAVTSPTESGTLVGTLAYMAPEGAESGEAMDTRTDVYGLGVVAYELLAGRPPFDLQGRSFAESVRIIRESVPPGLGTLSRALRGDVATIVGKAMAKEKARRYESAHALAEDIGRYLNNEPITARPASTWYQVRKFASRNRALVAGVVTVFAVLVAGFAGTTAGFVGQRRLRLEAEKARAEAEAARAREAAALDQANAQRSAAEEALAQFKAARARELAAAADKARAEDAAERQRVAATRAQAAEQSALTLLDDEKRRLAVLEAQRLAAAEAAAREQRQALSAGMQVYSINVRAADAALAAGDVAGARKLLDLCPEALRGWEWNYLDVLAGKGAVELPATDSRPAALAFSPDGSHVAVGYGDASVRVWEVQAGRGGREVVALNGHTAPVHAVAYAVGGGAGKWIVTGAGAGMTDNTARVWDAATGKELVALRGHTGPVRAAAFSPDATRVLTGSDDGTARVWDARAGRELFRVTCGGGVTAVAFSTKGTRFATASDTPGRAVQLWSAAAPGNLVATFGAPTGARSVDFSPEPGAESGRLLVTCADGKVRMWEPATQRTSELTIPRLEEGTQPLAACFGTNEQRFVIALDDRSLRVFDAGRQVTELRPGGPDATLADHGTAFAVFSADDRFLAGVTGDGRVRVWPTVFGDGTTELRETTSASFAPDGRHLATVSEVEGLRTPMIRDTVGRLERRLTGRDAGAIRAVIYSPTGKRVAGIGPAGQGAVVAVWDVDSGRQLSTLRLRAGISDAAAAFSPEGFLLYTGGEGATAWDAAAGKVVRTYGAATDLVTAVEVSPDGRTLAAAVGGGAGGAGRAVELFEASTGKLLHSLHGHAKPVGAMRFSPDGRRLLTRGEDGVVIMWDTVTGERLRTLPDAHYRGAPAFTPDGSRLALIVGGSEPRVSLCDGQLGVELCAIRMPANAVAWSPDGARFLVLNGTAAKIWDSRVPATRPAGGMEGAAGPEGPR
jgi:WD40 repeat protein